MSENLFINRELSWLKFNERVLGEAARTDVPLCERLLFLSIFQTNLDEFFKVRVGTLVDRAKLEKAPDDKTRMTPREQLAAIRAEVLRLSPIRDGIYGTLMEAVDDAGERLVPENGWSKAARVGLRKFMDNEVMPVLSPTVIGKHRTPPFLRDKDIYLAARLREKGGKERLGLVNCTSPLFPRVIRLAGAENEFALVEDAIRDGAHRLFPEHDVLETALFRVTRNADVDPDREYDDVTDYREFMAQLMKRRRRLDPVRLELDTGAGKGLEKVLRQAVGIDAEWVFRTSAPFDFGFVGDIRDRLRANPALFYPKFMPQPPATPGLFAYPYESMKPFLAMLKEAANDPAVIAIRMTLYRVARGSQVVEALVEAAENGKDVQVLVELKARFDEENNIEWSRRLERAGCQVIYGLDGYKVHSKLCLILRSGPKGVQYVTQIGTGNYNEKTAKLYTDFSIVTESARIGRDAVGIFRALAMGETPTAAKELLVAPNLLLSRVLAMMNAEIAKARAGKGAYIGLKLNALTDRTLIEKLVEASKAGVTVDMVVRGICCLRPGVPGETDHIRVISIVGRFLEHARVYIFGANARTAKVYISSADFMTRNTSRRVEVAAPVGDAKARARILGMFRTMLADNCQAHELKADGNYYRISNEAPAVDSQAHFSGTEKVE